LLTHRNLEVDKLINFSNVHGRGSDKAPVTLSVKCISVGLLLRIIFYLTAVGGRISNAMFMDDLVPSYGTW